MTPKMGAMEQKVVEALARQRPGHTVSALAIAFEVAGLTRGSRSRELPPTLRVSVQRALRTLGLKGVVVSEDRYSSFVRGDIKHWQLAGHASPPGLDLVFGCFVVNTTTMP